VGVPAASIGGASGAQVASLKAATGHTQTATTR